MLQDTAVLFSESQKHMPWVKFSSQYKTLKNEDRVVAGHLKIGNSSSLEISACAVFDGHNGSSTALYCRQHFLAELSRWFPPYSLPPETDVMAFQATFYELDRRSNEAGYKSGCTASAIIVTGWLATVANVGDSDVMVQTLAEQRIVSHNHRIGADDQELLRLKSEGAHVAQLSTNLRGPASTGEDGVGSLRIWPGGLAVSRAIGDAVLSRHVIAVPHITQLRIPGTGARFIRRF
uniref:PPM-type phosphatase domain-containing protein n=1 Tax=Tetraselmis sp. GSL018 TaxID=582737 RepID=A0A061SDA4_9CHLO